MKEFGGVGGDGIPPFKVHERVVSFRNGFRAGSGSWFKNLMGRLGIRC